MEPEREGEKREGGRVSPAHGRWPVGVDRQMSEGVTAVGARVSWDWLPAPWSLAVRVHK